MAHKIGFNIYLVPTICVNAILRDHTIQTLIRKMNNNKTFNKPLFLLSIKFYTLKINFDIPMHLLTWILL